MKTCLFIDDDEDDHEMFALALHETAKSFRLVVCKSAFEVFSKLTDESFTPDYIFLDLNMPGINGYDILKTIRRIERLDNTPVCIYTTSTNQHDKELVLELGANDFVSKPGKFSSIVEIIDERLI